MLGFLWLLGSFVGSAHQFFMPTTKNLNDGGSYSTRTTMTLQTEHLALTIKFWTLVAVCYYYGGIPFLWKFGFIMALIDWVIDSGYINPLLTL